MDLTLAQRKAAGEQIAREHEARKWGSGRTPGTRERKAVVEAAYRKAGLTVKDNAKISARGAVELARWSKEGSQYLLRSDGALLSNLGYGWKTFRKFKAETPREKWVALCDQWLRSKGFARANTAPVKNLFWKDIPVGARVELRGKPGSRYYVSGGKTVFWGGQDATEAQQWLDAAVKRSAPAKKNPILMTVAGVANPAKKAKGKAKAAAKIVGKGILGGVGSAAGALAAAPLLRKLVGANPSMTTRWESRGGKYWVELYADERGYSYRADGGGGFFGKDTETAAKGIRRVLDSYKSSGIHLARKLGQGGTLITTNPLTKVFKAGDKVMFAREFLRNTGQYTGWAPFAKGVVQSTTKLNEKQVVSVKWKDGKISKAISPNLVLASELHLEQRNPPIKQYAVFRTTARHPARPGGDWIAIQITKHGQSEEIKRGAYTLRPVYGVVAKSAREAVAIGKSRFAAGENPAGRKGTIRMAEGDRADEVKAIAQYGDHARKTGCPQARKAFRHIAGEERHHLKELDALLAHLHGGVVRSNPHIVIDPSEDRVWSIFKGSRPDSTFTLAYDRAAQAARETGRDFYIVAHPYVPPGWQRGTRISKLFYHQGPFIAVRPDGSTRNMGQSNPGRPHRNPGRQIGGRGEIGSEIRRGGRTWRIHDAYPSRITAEAYAEEINEAHGAFIEAYPTDAAVVDLGPGDRLRYAVYVTRRIGSNPLTSGEAAHLVRTGESYARYSRTIPPPTREVMAGKALGIAETALNMLDRKAPHMPVIAGKQRIEAIAHGVEENPLVPDKNLAPEENLAWEIARRHAPQTDADAERLVGVVAAELRATGVSASRAYEVAGSAVWAQHRTLERVAERKRRAAGFQTNPSYAVYDFKKGKPISGPHTTKQGMRVRDAMNREEHGELVMVVGRGWQTKTGQEPRYGLVAWGKRLENPPASRGRYLRERLASPAAFQKGSFRTVASGSGHKVVIGRPRGKTATRAQSILHPMSERLKLAARGTRVEVGTGRRRGAAKAAANPPTRRTMTLNEYMQWAKVNRQTAVVAELQKKFGEYEKWTHGTRAHKVTLERIPHGSVRGIWTMYDMGRQPEALYAMPRGTKRTGLWRHKWEKWPRMMGDSQRGLILTKLVKGNKITDFLHGN